MKRKFLAAMALAVSISAVPLTAYASATVSSSSSREYDSLRYKVNLRVRR